MAPIAQHSTSCAIGSCMQVQRLVQRVTELEASVNRLSQKAGKYDDMIEGTDAKVDKASVSTVFGLPEQCSTACFGSQASAQQSKKAQKPSCVITAHPHACGIARRCLPTPLSCTTSCRRSSSCCRQLWRSRPRSTMRQRQGSRKPRRWAVFTASHTSAAVKACSQHMASQVLQHAYGPALFCITRWCVTCAQACAVAAPALCAGWAAAVAVAHACTSCAVLRACAGLCQGR